MEELEENKQISKKVCALEVYRTCKGVNTICYIGMAGFFIVAVVSVFNKYGGSISAGLLCAGLGYYLYQNNNKMNYLNDTYKLGFKKAEKKEGRGF
jgi:hypothetical protein